MQAIDIACRGMDIIEDHAGLRVLITRGGSRVGGEQTAIAGVKDRFCGGIKWEKHTNKPPGGRGRGKSQLRQAGEDFVARGYFDFASAAKDAPADTIGESFPRAQCKWW